MAGYSFVSYIFQLKDRHNGNILIDHKGHIVHIDFGFVLTQYPGGISFENAPFKFTEEYLDILGGTNGLTFFYFKKLLFEAFNIFKKFSEELWCLFELMKSSEIPCFRSFDMKVFKDRFHRFCSDDEREKLVHDLIMTSLFSKRTLYYD